MISASSMISGKTHPPQPPGHGILKNGLPPPHHGHQNVHGMENRLRMDSQKFLVPSLPPSSGRHEVTGGMSLKRKERSLHNGNGSLPLEINYPMTNGIRRCNNVQRTPSPPQQQSPRLRDQSHSSAMYNDMLHPSHHPLLTHHHQMPTNPANYHPSRSSVPIPCSSPAPASSASPKAMSPSTNSNTGTNQNGRSSVYSPQLPGGHGELNLSSRLYSHPPNGYPHPHHPNLGISNHPAAFFAAAAAAAASGSHYPLFGGSPYAPHSHPAAASSYLDSFHSNILAQQHQQHQLKLGSGQPGTASALGLSTTAASYLPPHLRLSYHQHGTSTTSLHTKLIESSSERYSGHAHTHQHVGHTVPTSREYNGISGVHCNGLSKGGPLGISSLDLPLTHAPQLHQSMRKNISQGGKESGTKVNQPKHQWNERDNLSISQPLYPKTSPTNGVSISAYEYQQGNGEQKQSTFPSPAHSGRENTMYRQRIGNLTSIDITEDAIPNKMAKPNNALNNFTFPGDGSSNLVQGGRNGRPTNRFYYDFENGFKDTRESESLDLNIRNFPIGPPISNQPQFQAPESPKRRKIGGSSGIQWSCAVAPSITSSQQMPTTVGEKYLNHQNQKTLKTDSVPASTSGLQKSSPGPNISVAAQSPSSKVPKSPTVTFKLSPKVPPSPKKILQTHNENHLNSRSLLLPPLPIEEMPLLEAFRRGSLIQLATGEVKSIENLCGEDFAHSAAKVGDSMRIVYCTVLAIQEMEPPTPTQPSFGKVTLGMESHKQQIVLESTLEQPFFTMGSGWSSLCPKSSKRLLQLQCSSLRVGDICMTLTRTPGKTHSSGTASSLRSGTSKPRNYSILSSPKANNVTAKGSNPNNITTGSTMKKQLGTKSTTIASGANEMSQATAMLPPPSPLLPSITNVKVIQSQRCDESTSSSGLSSLKKRRWSAPEPEVNDDVAEKNSTMKQEMEEKETTT